MTQVYVRQCRIKRLSRVVILATLEQKLFTSYRVPKQSSHAFYISFRINLSLLQLF
uniref:Uncharacterized protein n=1 Tax=Hyaloperonospora arabidopsidis (strain Emoy2) TaxID=559515 RepID=M4B8M5_HYAAE